MTTAEIWFLATAGPAALFGVFRAGQAIYYATLTAKGGEL